MISPLLTDLYELNMVQAYLDRGEDKEAVFEFFVRRLPPRRGFLLAAGLEEALTYLETLAYSAQDIDWLKHTGRFHDNLLDYLKAFRFTGDVDAIPEGTVCFPGEPLLRITAPLPMAQLIETRIINLMHFNTLIASKAARMVLAAPGKILSDFGLRSAHGAEAGLFSARASYIAGFSSAANVLAGVRYGIPVAGTMAHSYIQVHTDEAQAFEDFARTRPNGVILLIDTYDTEQGARKVVDLAPKLKADGISIFGVRIDSGDLIAHARKVRKILDDGGLKDVIILVSGGINEDVLLQMKAENAPIDGFGIGVNLDSSIDAPSLDCAYKLQEYAGIPRRKRSEGKATWPGRKQVWRAYDLDGRMAGDVLSVETDKHPGETLIVPVMRGGRRLAPAPSLDEIRARAARDLARLPEPLRRLEQGVTYPVQVADALVKLADEADRHTAGK
ncbi:nicotinate phosphoribosyltransferase [Pseudolabrys taiwanensis]|uniref:Nicotinate phosphoribosyltransferase n=1 Tax=Pseudolabrys taiwanensis TaxID=331696 RepID=A0A345ZSB7_9HYPH|nr:nicotinate phosphoribosyltransferase [Pseudolabrys taiwanensis]AXK79814.1 nicotinate phosphoribosyltransferase [Pseudolabrys taiwanensis]